MLNKPKNYCSNLNKKYNKHGSGYLRQDILRNEINMYDI